MPEPIYRVRFDSGVEDALKSAKPESRGAGAAEQPRVKARPSSNYDSDVAADNTIDEKVDAERASSSEADLLDEQSPVE